MVVQLVVQLPLNVSDRRAGSCGTGRYVSNLIAVVENYVSSPEEKYFANMLLPPKQALGMREAKVLLSRNLDGVVYAHAK